MTAGFWTGLAAWAVVVATAFGAVLFGQLAREALRRYPRGHVPQQVRVGTALSIAGPVLVLIVGLVVGMATGAWIATALATFLGVLGAAGLGWVLAPR